MSIFVKFLITVIYLLIIAYGTHFLRSRAFNRYEGVTFECSFITVLIAPLLIWKYGFSVWLIVLFAVFAVLFIANGLAQRKYYDKLQERIAKAVEIRTGKEEGRNEENLAGRLKKLGAASIMPSFSTFIEESRFFKKQGGLIGLIKTSMKRQHFQDQKYVMRECFADMLNLIGPCKAEIVLSREDLKKKEAGTGTEETPVIRPAVRANDLALTAKDEKKGLAAFDILGFGGLLLLLIVLVVFFVRNPTGAAGGNAVMKTAAALAAAAVVTVLGHLLRRKAFVRPESAVYEAFFAVTVVSSFFAFDTLANGACCGLVKGLIFLLAVVIFAALTFFFRHRDRKHQEETDAMFEEYLYHIIPDSETNRTKRRFIRDMKTLSIWAASPSTDAYMRPLMEELIKQAAPEVTIPGRSDKT
ncbi:MAG: hypothetical protein IJH99_08515 [Eubacterium sp.]|nr:hypothetical protein [Eubacterium sp.]